MTRDQPSIEAAKERVQKYHPAPKCEPLNAGLAGIAIAAGPVGIFLALAGLDQEGFANIIAIMAIIGFAMPYFYFRHAHSKYQQEVVREYNRMLQIDKR